MVLYEHGPFAKAPDPKPSDGVCILLFPRVLCSGLPGAKVLSYRKFYLAVTCCSLLPSSRAVSK